MLIREGLDLNHCGIYSINCCLTGMSYIGSSINIARRYKDHFKGLYGNKHPNSKLQKAYNDHPDSFYFDLLEVCEMKHLIERENHWIREKDSVDNGFNLCKYSCNTGTKNKTTIRKLNKVRKDNTLLEDFYESMREFVLYKDREFPEGVTLTVYNLNITEGKQCPSRFAKLGKILTSCMSDLHKTESGVYKLTHVNYIDSNGGYRLEKQGDKLSSNITKVMTAQIYDRLANLVVEALSSTKEGKRCLTALSKAGVDLIKYEGTI